MSDMTPEFFWNAQKRLMLRAIASGLTEPYRFTAPNMPTQEAWDDFMLAVRGLAQAEGYVVSFNLMNSGRILGEIDLSATA